MKTLPEIMLDPDYINCVEEAIAHMLEGYRESVERSADEYHFEHPKRAVILNNGIKNANLVKELLSALYVEHDKIHS